jgi:hypothetical protein
MRLPPLFLCALAFHTAQAHAVLLINPPGAVRIRGCRLWGVVLLYDCNGCDGSGLIVFKEAHSSRSAHERQHEPVIAFSYTMAT